MENTETKELRYRGRISQTFLYLGKFLRLLVLQSDWKVLPMSGIIAALVSMAIGRGLFATMEGTFQGSFAIACVCMWNGVFNSIQSICRERAIVKREHRAGLHVSSYVAAHLIYQMILCALQALITIEVCRVMGVAYPAKGVIFEEFSPDLFITLFLITYSADVVALMISAIVHTPMAAMTVMPFVLIIQLVFAGFFSLPDRLEQVSDLMISRWGVQGICVLADYNELPAVLVWNSLVKNGATLEVEGVSLKDVLAIAEEEGMKDEILLRLGEANRRDDFAPTAENLADCWIHLALFTVVAAVITMFFLEFIDRDRR